MASKTLTDTARASDAISVLLPHYAVNLTDTVQASDTLHRALPSYTKLADLIVDQLYGVVELNKLLNNYRFAAESVLQDPSTNSDLVKAVTLDNGATDGGRIAFDGNTAKMIRCDAAGAYLEWNGIDLKVPSPQRVIGDRWILTMRMDDHSADDRFIAAASTQRCRYVMPRAGSILSVSFNAGCDSAPNPGTCYLRLYKNTSSVVDSTGFYFDGAGDTFNETFTYSRGTTTFSAGDTIDFMFDGTGGTGPRVIGCCVVEGVFDA